MSLADLFQPAKPIVLPGRTIVHVMPEDSASSWDSAMRAAAAARAREARSLDHLTPQERLQRRRQQRREARDRFREKQRARP